MVKLFGWEQKMSQKLKDAREEELKWLFRDKVKDDFCKILFVLTLADL